MIARRSGRPGASPRREAGDVPTLPAWKAFVVQLSRDTAPGSGIFAGRVEHLNSGRQARFDSPQSLLAVLDRLLRDIVDQST